MILVLFYLKVCYFESFFCGGSGNYKKLYIIWFMWQMES